MKLFAKQFLSFQFLMRQLLVFLLTLLSFSLLAQDKYKIGLLPAIDINQKLPANFKINYKIESRQGFYYGKFQHGGAFEYKNVLTDFSMLGSKKIKENQSIYAGYLLRIRDGKLYFRTIQQFSFYRRINRFRLTHRISLDQTFANKEFPLFRLRYRISPELAFGDPKDYSGLFYTKLGVEWLNGLTSGEYEVEIRLTPTMGYKFDENRKIELGLDYRVESVFQEHSSHSFWIALSWFQDL